MKENSPSQRDTYETLERKTILRVREIINVTKAWKWILRVRELAVETREGQWILRCTWYYMNPSFSIFFSAYIPRHHITIIMGTRRTKKHLFKFKSGFVIKITRSSGDHWVTEKWNILKCGIADWDPKCGMTEIS